MNNFYQLGQAAYAYRKVEDAYNRAWLAKNAYDKAEKALKATPECKAKDEAWEAVKETPEYKAWKEKKEALTEIPEFNDYLEAKVSCEMANEALKYQKY